MRDSRQRRAQQTEWPLTKVTGIADHNHKSATAGGDYAFGDIVAADVTYLQALVADITQTDLVDKSATEVISGTWQFTNTGLRLLDTDASHNLNLKPGSNLTANRILTITTGDADRTITFSGNPTLADWFDQAVKTTSTPTFVGVNLSSGTIDSSVTTPTDLDITCGANKTIELQNVVYDDIQVSISNIRVPAANAPTERLYNHGVGGGVTFPVLGFALNDYMYFDVQTSHSMKLNTVIDSHMHFMTPTDGSGTPDRFQFQLDVIAAAIDGSWAVPTGSPFTSEHIIAADYTNKHKLLEIANIPASNSTVSTLYSCKLTRIAATQDEYGSEVYVKYTDSHYQKNTMGSRQENVK
jgi:hypothetical protein